jgi:putative ABC transport system permease protein
VASRRTHRRLGIEARLLRAALWRRRGTVALAVLAVAIGASVASALLHVSSDIGLKVSRELRALGPNLLVVPAGDEARFMDEAAVRARLAAAGLEGVPILYAVASHDGRLVPLVGADITAARRLHPAWRVTGASAGDPLAPLIRGGGGGVMGARLMGRLGIAPGATMTLLPTGEGGAPVTVTVGARLEAGGPDDEALWIPLDLAQRVSGHAGRVSLAQSRIEHREAAGSAIEAIERDGTMRGLVLHALSATEGRLLERMRHLMTLVTVAALVAAGLCAFGTLTDLALERRREIALMKALGATRADVVRLFTVESLTIGAFGGLIGWLLGVMFAEIIGREVFHSAIALHADVPLLVMALALGVAGLAGLGPIRLALAVEPAPVLKGD